MTANFASQSFAEDSDNAPSGPGTSSAHRQVRDPRQAPSGRSEVTELASLDAGPSILPHGLRAVTAAPTTQPRSGEFPTGAGKHASKRRYWSRSGTRFAIFAVIGAVVFLVGLGMQAAFTGGLGWSAMSSYMLQAFLSIQASFLLNRRLTWRDRNTPLWRACWRFNVQKTVMTVVNLVAYAALLRLGMNYLVGNVVLTAVFAVLNFVGGDRLVFIPTGRPDEPAKLAVGGLELPISPVQLRQIATGYQPTVSVVIPCKDNLRTIRATVDSLLNQDYPALAEVIVVGSTQDTTWQALEDVDDPRLVKLAQSAAPGKRDPNVKRDAGLRAARGEVLALADSDIVMDSDWLSRAISHLIAQRGGVVAGGMRSIHSSFWGRFVDRNLLAAKTPRLAEPYLVTAENFGRRGTRPPITANAIFTRVVYETCALDVTWAYGYEDYEWFWRVAKAGHKILFTGEISGAHHHRRGLRKLATEYQRSAVGCAHFIHIHPDSPLARKRRLEALGLPVMTAVAALLAGIIAAAGRAELLALTAVAAMFVLMGREVISARRIEAIAYPCAGLVLGAVFTWNLATSLILRKTQVKDAPVWATPSTRPPRMRARMLRGISWPLSVILAVQAALSLSLVWSNTAFRDEAEYLLQGRLELSHWLHGYPIPPFNEVISAK